MGSLFNVRGVKLPVGVRRFRMLVCCLSSRTVVAVQQQRNTIFILLFKLQLRHISSFYAKRALAPTTAVDVDVKSLITRHL